MSNNEFHQRRLSATPRGVGVMCNFFAQSAENATLKDVEGNEYIDFAAGIAVLNTGHRHPDLVAAVEQQLQQFTHTAYQIVPYESYVTLAEKINALAPVSGQAKTAFFTTGAEAVENAVKIARAHTGRPGVIAFSGGFHGRTYMTMALTGKVAPYKIGFGPFPGSVYHVPYPSDLHGISTQDSLDAIERLFKSDIEAKQVAAIIFEPVQGEGGVLPVDPAFAKRVRELCDKHHALLILDEVQSGCARSGTFFAYEQIGIRPDIVTTAKGLAGGVPIGCVLTNDAVAKHFKPGTHGSTFGGNALACAVGNAVLKHISAPEFLEKVVKHGAFMKASLEALNKELHVFTEVRGMGLLIGCELIPQLRAQLGDIQKAAHHQEA